MRTLGFAALANALWMRIGQSRARAKDIKALIQLARAVCPCID
jgi:hypothetical protein